MTRTRTKPRKLSLARRVQISDGLKRHYSEEANRYAHSLARLSKLSPRDFARIRNSRGTHVEIAAKFGISRSYVTSIRNAHRGTYH
mgnify:CR=1 FL=1